MKQFRNKHTGTIATKMNRGPFSTFEFEGYSVNVICELSGDWEPVEESDIHIWEQAIPDKTNIEDSVKALCGAMDKLGKDRVSQIIKDVKKQFGDHKFIFEIPDEEEPSWTLAELESLNTCGDQMKGEYLVIKKSDLI